MSEIDGSARDEGRCGYIGDGRETPCQLTEGWGYENTDAGLCRNHSNRGGQDGNQNSVGNSGGGAPEGNGNAETHGAYRENFLEDYMSAAEAGRVATVEGLLSAPEGSQKLARMMAGVALEQFRRSENVQFLAEFRRICEKAGVFPDEENSQHHTHEHQTDDSGTRELTNRERAAIDSITGGPEWERDENGEYKLPGEVDDDLDADAEAAFEDDAAAEDDDAGDDVEDEDEDGDEGGDLKIGW